MLYVRLLNNFVMSIGRFLYVSLSKNLEAVTSSVIFGSMRYIRLLPKLLENCFLKYKHGIYKLSCISYFQLAANEGKYLSLEKKKV